jgi:hypothetical protein
LAKIIYNLKESAHIIKNKLKCHQQTTRLAEAFPMVAHYLNNELGPFLISLCEIKINSQTNLYRQTVIKEKENIIFYDLKNIDYII